MPAHPPPVPGRPEPAMRIEQLRRDPLAHLPALLALALAAMALPAQAQARLVTLCSGGSLPVPGRGQDPGCEQACHVGCRREGAAAGKPPA